MTENSQIPKQFHEPGLRFTRPPKGEKNPIDKKWQKIGVGNFALGDPKLIDHMKNGNVGVLCGINGITDLDCDEPELIQLARKELPPTYTQRGNRERLAFVFRVKGELKNYKLQKNGKHYGEIRFSRQHFVIPPSIHTSGLPYEIVDDLPIAEISTEQLLFVLRGYISEYPEWVESYKKESVLINVPIGKVIDLDTLKQSESDPNEYFGSHSIHGSTTGHNLWVNTLDNTWYCHRCDGGGGALEWIAVIEGLLQCSKAKPKALRGDLFKKVIEITKAKYKIEIPATFAPVENKEGLKREILIEDVFGNEKKPYKSIGMGVHNGVFYYGTAPGIEGNPTSIITSDRNYFLGEDIKGEFGLNYREEFDEQAIDFGWSNRAISRFLKGEHTNVDIKQVFDKIAGIYSKYMDFLNPAIPKYLACAIISDYCYWLFSHKGRIFFTGETGSGKTKACKIYWLLGFNTMWISNTSEANLFRSIEATAGTPIVDNEDNLNEEAKKTLAQQWQTGFGVESLYRRVEGDAKKKTRKFVNFSPMIKNNIGGIDEPSFNRAHAIKLLKTTTGKGKLDPEKESPTPYEEIRNDLRVFVLETWQKIKEVAENIELKGLENREIDVEKPALVVAKLISDELYKELLSYVKGHWGERRVKDFDTDWGYFLFKEIYEFLGDKKADWISYKDLTDRLLPVFYGVSEQSARDYKVLWTSANRFIAKSLANIPLFDKKRIVMGYTERFFKIDKVKQWIRLQNYPIGGKTKQQQLGGHSTALSDSF